MKNIKLAMFALAGILFGCQQAEMVDPTENAGKAMKTVTIKAEMNVTDTKASIDSETGTVTWQSGDLLSVLTTDDVFYDFILTSGAGEKFAEFEGKIPEAADVVITTVATYPRIIGDGEYNMIQFGDELLYYLPEEWNYAANVSNVPMVAAFEAGAEELSFKQVGGVMRFPIKNLPGKSKVVFTMADKVITGDFPVDLSALGESAMEAGEGESEVTINYTFEETADVELNLPVPTGVYNNFTLTIYNKDNEAIFTKQYTAENEVKRATLLLMSEIVVPEQPLEIAEVWPFFVDARVILPKVEGATQYAVYVDGAEEPVLVDAEDWGENAGLLVGGEFAHMSTHTVAVAKVVEGEVVAETKSKPVSFTTVGVYQLTKNTGTQFVAVGWDDVTIAEGPKFVNGKWTAVNSDLLEDVDAQGRKLHQRRGYEVQLYAADKTTLLYDLVPFAGHSIYQNAFYDAKTLGKINGGNLVTPAALTFGHLEPGKEYYFRVKAIDGVKIISIENGNYYPGDDNVSSIKPYPYPLSSARGGCAWSELVKLTTDAEHVPSENEILHEDFDDFQLNADPMNWAVSVVPDFAHSTTDALHYDDYLKTALAAGYDAFYALPENERKWTVQDFNKIHYAAYFGMFAETWVKNSTLTLNNRARSLEGWKVYTVDSGRLNLMPGYVGLGKGYENHGGMHLITPALDSDKLDAEKGTKCTVTLQVSYMSQAKAQVANTLYVCVNRDGVDATETEKTLCIADIYPEEWAAEFTPYHIDNGDGSNGSSDYQHHSRFYEVKTELYLKKGDAVKMFKKTAKPQYGYVTIGDVKIEVHPGEFEPELQ